MCIKVKLLKHLKEKNKKNKNVILLFLRRTYHTMSFTSFIMLELNVIKSCKVFACYHPNHFKQSSHWIMLMSSLDLWQALQSQSSGSTHPFSASNFSSLIPLN